MHWHFAKLLSKMFLETYSGELTNAWKNLMLYEQYTLAIDPHTDVAISYIWVYNFIRTHAYVVTKLKTYT